MDKHKNNYKLPPRLSMGEYMDAVGLLLESKNALHIQKQKAIEKCIKTPFTFDQNQQQQNEENCKR